MIREGEFRADAIDDTGDEYVDDHLVVREVGAIHARPRTENFIIEDLRKQREKLEQRHSNGEPLPGVLKKLMRIASDAAAPPISPSPFPTGVGSPDVAERQFYLPKSHNDDQIEIVRKLDAFGQDGAVSPRPARYG